MTTPESDNNKKVGNDTAQALEQGRLLFAKQCDFILGATNMDQVPVSELPEIAFAGRSNVGMSFPVNLPSSAFRLTTAKNSSDEFIVNAISTDGGSHPRNVAIQSAMALVAFNALTPLEMAEKLSWNAAKMLGLYNKGNFSEGADADVTVLDPERNQPEMSLVAGKLIMYKGQPVGSGGTLLVAQEGRRIAAASGLPYQVIDLSQSKLYEGFTD